jgi:hypothetical protein
MKKKYVIFYIIQVYFIKLHSMAKRKSKLLNETMKGTKTADLINKEMVNAMTVAKLKALIKSKSLFTSYSTLRKPELIKKILNSEWFKGQSKTITAKVGDKISVGHAIINIYTGGTGHPNYPIPHSVVKSALDANNLTTAQQSEILQMANNAPPAPTIKKSFMPPTPPDIITNNWKGRAVKPPKVELTPEQKKAMLEAENRASHMDLLKQAIEERRARAEGK